MKKYKSFLVVFLLLINIHNLFSQEKNENLILFNSAPEMNYEYLAYQLDLFVSELNQAPNSTGYIVMYIGANAIENAFYKYAFNGYIHRRGFDDKRILLLTTAGSNKPKFEFWISKDGAKPKIKEENLSLSLPNNKSVDFVGGLVEIVNIDGKQHFLDVGCDGGCIKTLNFFLLSDFLEANPQTKAYVIIHAKSFKRAKRVKDVLTEEAIEGAEIPSNRLKFLFGGKNKINENDFSEVEVYIASDDSQLPKPTSIKHRPL